MTGTRHGHWPVASLDLVSDRFQIIRVADRLVFHGTSMAVVRAFAASRLGSLSIAT